jgi:hypothetical protein
MSGPFLHLSEKAKYLFTWLRQELTIPTFSDTEVKNITDFDSFTNAFRECNATSFCRGLCYTMINGQGISFNHTMPSIIYLDWFSTYFKALRLTKEKEKLGNSTRRLLLGPGQAGQAGQQGSYQRDTRPLKLGHIYEQDFKGKWMA